MEKLKFDSKKIALEIQAILMQVQRTEKVVERHEYHPRVQHILSLLGWSISENEIEHEKKIEGTIDKPDFTISKSKNGKVQFPVEVKGHQKLTKDDLDQLNEYIRLLGSKVGIMFKKNSICVYDSKENKLRLIKEFSINLFDVEGETFVKLFHKENFNQQSIREFVKEIEIKQIKEEAKKYVKNNLDKVYRIFLKQTYSRLNDSDIDDIIDDIINRESIYTNEDSKLKKSYQELYNTSSEISIDSQNDKSSDCQNESKKNDNTKYIINDDSSKLLTKRTLVWSVISNFTKSNKFDKIKSIFPNEIQGSSYGTVKTIKEIERISNKSRRYLLNPEQILESTDGVKFCVCSQWNIKNIQNFLPIAEKLGYKITVRALKQ